jgi:hypothetical protein
MMGRASISVAALALAMLADSSLRAQRAAPDSGTKAHVTALASERAEGRLTGTAGEQAAADYIVAELTRIGAKPLPGQTSFRLPFQFTAGTRDGGSAIAINRNPTTGPRFTNRADVQALSFSDDGSAEGTLAFAGYGIVVPESQGFGYDSYAGLDVKDKIVLVLRYFPEDADQQTRGILARYSDLRYKAMAARQRGAKAMLVVTGPRSPNAGEIVPMTFDTALSGSGIVAASVSGAVARQLLDEAGRTPEEIQRSYDSGDPHVAGFDLASVTVTVRASVVRERRTGNNVVAYLPATAPTGGLERPWIALGAHYDHLGRGQAGSSLATKDESGRIHYGADDNASGAAALLAAAEALSREPRHRDVLLEWWSGEELGMLGSNAFLASPPVPPDRIQAYLNFDMVGRMRDNKLTVQATGTSAAWPRILEQANVVAGFDLQLQEDPYQPTDVSSFSQAGVPSLNFFTGTHSDYHRPSDTADKINYEDLDRVVEFATAIARRAGDAAEPLPFTKVEPRVTPGARAGLRIFTGTIPDYSTDVKGLLLSGVIGGGPAEQAGLRKGDIIVEIAGQTIANIYDYTYALDVLKVGEPSKVVYLRDGQRMQTTLTPAARR